MQLAVDAMLATIEDALETGASNAPPMKHTTYVRDLSQSTPFSLSVGSLFPVRDHSKPTAVAPLRTATDDATVSLNSLEEHLATKTAGSLTCSQYDEAAYLSRQATFTPCGHWHDKPTSILPPTCARYGWTLAGLNRLTCLTCGACVMAPDTLTSAACDMQIGAVVAEQLTTAHAKLCPWRGNVSPASLSALLLPGNHGAPPALLHGVAIGRESIRRRAAGILALPNLPKLAASAEPHLVACATACGYGDREAFREAIFDLTGVNRTNERLADSNGSHAAREADRRWVTAVLALLGWSAGGAPSTLFCLEDASTIGLWSYELLPRGTGGAPLIVAEDPAVAFDPIAEHRAWSPWILPCEGDSVPAWVRCAKLLLPVSSIGSQASL